MRRVLIAVLSCALILLPLLAAGQQQGLIVSGKITDEAGNALPGTNVVLKGYDLGAAADLNGAYRFVVPARYMNGNEIEISAAFIGYHSKTEKIVLSPGSITVDFELKMDVLEMDAVVVTGVAEATPKTMLPFTVSRVSNEQVEMVPATNAVASLQGKVAGVAMVRASGKPGDGISVRLRSATDITGSNAPLYIVDGVILGSGNVDIDALDIESMEVVKGAAAASLYGSRAANGVINIKTKRGNLLGVGETRIRFRNEFGLNQFVEKEYRSESHEYKVATVADTLTFVNDAGTPVDFGHSVLDDDLGYAIQDNPFPGEIYDHLGLFFDPGYFYTNTLSISQHKPGTNYLLSFGNLKESGIVDGLDGYNRQHVRLNLDHKVREGLNLSTTAYFSTSRRDDPQGTINPFYALMFINPNADLLADNADGTPYIIQPDPRTQEENPLYAINFMDLEDTRKRLMGAFTLNWAPMTWFNIEGNFSYDRGDGLSTTYYPNGFKSVDGQNVPTGFYQRYNWMNEAINASVTASFYKNFGDLAAKFKLKAMIETDDFENTNASGQNLAVNDVPDLGIVQEAKSVDSFISEVRAIGYYATLDLDWQEKYILGLLFRYDGSSLFGADQRYHPYYRGSIAWRVSKEPFWFTDKINEFKVRYSYGTAGIRPGFDAQYETYSVAAGILSKGNLGNKDLKPAFSTEQEVGLEMAFLDRFSLEVTYANTVTKDQILLVPLPAVYGFGNQWQNAGTVKANSIEAELKAFILQGRNMSWSAGLVGDHYTQKITEFNRTPYSYGISQVYAFYYREGEVLGAMYGIKYIEKENELRDTYDPAMFDKNDDGYLVPVGSGNTWKDGIAKNLWGTNVNVALAGGTAINLPWGQPVKWVDPETGDNVKKIGDVIPDFSIGFNTTFKWKGLTLYMLIDAQIGGEIYNNTRQWAYRENRHVQCDQAGKKEYEKKPITYYQTLYDANSINSHFVEEGTYAKLRELSLQYSFDRVALGKVFGGFLANVFNRITVGLIGRNLLTLTNYSGFDPEVGVGDATLMRLDAFGYPQYRTFTGMLELEF